MVHVASPVSALTQDWQARLQQSQDALRREPAARQAWHWRVQVKVLRFLLARYGDAPHEAVAAPAGQLPGHQLFLMLNVLGIGKKPRSRETIRRTLENIAAVNRTAKW
jgi:hypothetical protein